MATSNVQQDDPQKSPLWFAPRKLCEIAGLTFLDITVGLPTAQPEISMWGVKTSDGIRMMLLGPNFAVLTDQNMTQKLARFEWAA